MPNSLADSAHINLVIWGMHRSGTSLLCTLLDKSGVYFGEPDQLVPPSNENPDGFWENIAVRNLNDGLLESVGCDWDHIARFTITGIPNDLLARSRKELSSICTELSRHPISGIKDPRMCLLTEAWQPVLEHSVNILVSRHPVEIAKSLTLRNNIPFEVGLCLCEYYLVHLLNYLSSKDYILVGHQDLLNRPGEIIGKLSRHILSITGRELQELSNETVDSVVHSEFYRAKLSEEQLPVPLQFIWENMRQGVLPHQILEVSDHSKSILKNYEGEESEKAFLLARGLQNTTRLQKLRLEKLESEVQTAHLAIKEKNIALQHKNSAIQNADQAMAILSAINHHLKRLTGGPGRAFLTTVSTAAKLLHISKLRNIDSRLTELTIGIDEKIDRYKQTRDPAEQSRKENRETIG